jgi:predicted amidohydrolase YtcJ
LQSGAIVRCRQTTPFLEIYRAVTRLHNHGKPEGGWNPSQKLSMYEILRSYTYGSAYGVRRENELGTLEPENLRILLPSAKIF